MHYEEVEDLKLEDEKQKIVKHHKLNNKRQEKKLQKYVYRWKI